MAAKDPALAQTLSIFNGGNGDDSIKLCVLASINFHTRAWIKGLRLNTPQNGVPDPIANASNLFYRFDALDVMRRNNVGREYRRFWNRVKND